MRSGRLRHRVTFSSATVSVNDLGEPTQSWSEMDVVWARVEPTAGKERFAAMQQQAEVDYVITCRYQSAFSDLAPEDRATWDGKTFDIKSVINPDERNIGLQVFAKRRYDLTSAYNVVTGHNNVVSGSDNVVSATL